MPAFFWLAGAAAERDVGAAADRVAADVGLGFDEDHRRPGLARDDGGGHSGRARPDDDDVRLAVPACGKGLRGGGRRCNAAGCGGAGNSARPDDKIAP